MNETILNYIVQAILGGASGYITNDYAINMLFKEYTPLKIGGVIKKTRSEFIDNLSSMVENDIISKEKLQSILNDESFKFEFENLTADFYNNSLYETVGLANFEHVDGFDATMDSTDIYVAKIINDYMPDLYKIIIENLNAEYFLTSKQLNTITNSLYSMLTDIVNNSQIVENVLLSFIKDNKQLTLNSIIEKNICESVIFNAGEKLSNSATEHKDKFKEILNSANITEALDSAIEILNNKKIKDVINLDRCNLKILNDSMLSYINSDIGTAYIYSIVDSLFSYAKDCDKSIFQLLDTSFKENLKIYLMDNIPLITDTVVEWINKNSHLIDYLIEESIDEVIKESDGIKAKLLSVIKNTFFSGLSKKYSIADKIISYVKDVAEPEILSEILSSKLIDILNNLTIGEITSEAEKNNITAETTVKLIVNYINKNSEDLIIKFTDNLSDIEINKILPEKLVDLEFKSTLLKKLTEFILSDTVKNYLSNKSIDYTDYLLSKELDNLISKEHVSITAAKLRVFINKKIVSNENSIKNWLGKELNYVAEELLNQNHTLHISDILNKEIYKNYKQVSENIRTMPISAALDKINSLDNLAKNSSEAIHKYTVNNTDIILRGSIKTIVTDNLNKLNDDELVMLANDFIGRELKPIMFFGGVLGVAAGLILAAFQSSPLDPVEIRISNMAVYSFVGYITNVIAINMIFKPYKENKFLAKIPFFRNFSLGYIVKNQKTFAQNTAHFIDNSLLSKKSINLLFDKYKDKIKKSLSKSIAGNNYQALSSLLNNNKASVTNSIYSYFKTKVKSNLNNIGVYTYNLFANKKLTYFVNNNTTRKMSVLFKQKLQNFDISDKVYSLTSSDITLENKISNEMIKNYIKDVENKYYDRLNAFLSDENKISSNILKLEDKYNIYSNKYLRDIISNENINKFAHTTASKIDSIIFTKESRDKITNKALSYIDDSIDKNKTFEELFNGKFKKYIDSKIPVMLDNITATIINDIKNNRSKISVKVQSEIKNKLGFIEKSMYNLMGGDAIIDELLSKIIIVKVPKFMEAKRDDLLTIAANLIDERFYKTKIGVLYTGLNILQCNDLVDNYLNQNNSTKIENKINTVTTELFKNAGNLKIESILKFFSVNDLKSLLKHYNNEIKAFSSKLSSNLMNNKKYIIASIFDFSDLIIDDFMKSEFKELFKGTSFEDIRLFTNNISSMLYENFEKIISSILNEASDHLDMDIGCIADKNEFIKSIERYCINIIENTDFQVTVAKQLESIIDDAVSVNFKFIDDRTKHYVVNIFTESCINSLKRNLDEILKSIEFDKVAREEIEKMEPQKIHEMFNSFGGKYFKTLMLYGFGGFVFGINMYVGFTLTALKIISELFSKKD